MNKHEKKFSERLERVLADIMLPGVHFLDVFEGTLNFELICGKSFDNYLDEVERFASSRKRDYNGFRDFLASHSELYFNKGLCNLSNSDIDCLFDKILEYQGDAILEKIGY
jgi:hypothetical protein